MQTVNNHRVHGTVNNSSNNNTNFINNDRGHSTVSTGTLTYGLHIYASQATNKNTGAKLQHMMENKMDKLVSSLLMRTAILCFVLT